MPLAQIEGNDLLDFALIQLDRMSGQEQAKAFAFIHQAGFFIPRRDIGQRPDIDFRCIHRKQVDHAGILVSLCLLRGL